MKEKQAKQLADWLDGKTDVNAVSAEVVEAIYIIRPDLAPSPNIDVEDILGNVEVGPLSETQQPVDEFPTEDLQNLFRPDLAAPPRVQLDDIFASLTEGPLSNQGQAVQDQLPENVISFPFSESSSDEIASAPAEETPSNVVSLGSEGVAGPMAASPAPIPKRSRVYAFSVFGSLLAAACALIVFLPTGTFQSMDSQPDANGSNTASAKPSEPLLKDYQVQPTAQAFDQDETEEMAVAMDNGAIGEARPNEYTEKYKAPGGIKLKKERSRKQKKASPPKTTVEQGQPLDMLRSLAWDFKLPTAVIDKELRQELQTKNSVEELKPYLTHHNPNVQLEAAYLIAQKGAQVGISSLESVLRVRGGHAKYRRRGYALLGDLYRQINNVEKSKYAYEAAIGL